MEAGGYECLPEPAQFWPPAKCRFHRAISIMSIFAHRVAEPLSYHAAAADPHPIGNYQDIQLCWEWCCQLHLELVHRQTPDSKSEKNIKI